MCVKLEEKAERWSQRLGSYAEQSLLTEAVLSPKPGLVDAYDAGAHTDMDIHTFILSAVVFRPYFTELVQLGMQHKGDVKELLPLIREIGIKAERAMFEETKGINTHKGVIFSIGILLTAYGVYLQAILDEQEELPAFTPTETNLVVDYVKQITEGLVERELNHLENKSFLTNGEKLYQKYGITGVRGEVEQGFPSVMEEVMPYLRATVDLKTDDRLLEALFLLMASSEDSNIIHRSNIETLQEVKKRAKEFLAQGGMKQPDAIQKITQFNKEFISKNISPGGSADLLSVAFLLAKMERII